MIALVWFYLQINGKPNEKLIDELLGVFDRNDFKSALIWLMLHDEEEMDITALQMKELISKHFETENELSIWSKDIFKQVVIVFQRIHFKFTFSMHHPFQEAFFMCQSRLKIKT